MSEGPFSESFPHLEDDCSACRIDPEASKVSMTIHKGINDSHVMMTFNLLNGNF